MTKLKLVMSNIDHKKCENKNFEFNRLYVLLIPDLHNQSYI